MERYSRDRELVITSSRVSVNSHISSQSLSYKQAIVSYS